MKNGIDFQKMAARVKKATGAETFAKLHDFVPVTASVDGVTPSVFKVVVTFSKDADKQALHRAVAAATQNKVAPVEASFRPIPGTKAFVGFVARNAEVREYETAAVEGMKVMASNLLMDEKDHSLWEVRSNDDAKYLVRHQEDDLSDLLALASVRIDNRELDIPVIASLGYSDAREQDCVVYVNPTTVEVSHGMVVASTGDSVKLVDITSKETLTVAADFVVEVASFNFDEMKGGFKEVAAPQEDTVLGMEDYWFKVFGQYPAYWAEFKKMLNSRATV